jgi:hypothetical protein
MALTTEEAREALGAIKTIHALAPKTENPGLVRAVAALHEAMKRYGEKHHPDVVAEGGST